MRNVVLTSALVLGILVSGTNVATAATFSNVAAVGWHQTEINGVPNPAPAPFTDVNGVRYRLGDADVQFHRYKAGGVQVILGSCDVIDAQRELAFEIYDTGAFSSLIDCDDDDSNNPQ